MKEAAEIMAESEVVGIEIAEFQNVWVEGGEPGQRSIARHVLRCRSSTGKSAESSGSGETRHQARETINVSARDAVVERQDSRLG